MSDPPQSGWIAGGCVVVADVFLFVRQIHADTVRFSDNKSLWTIAIFPGEYHENMVDFPTLCSFTGVYTWRIIPASNPHL